MQNIPAECPGLQTAVFPHGLPPLDQRPEMMNLPPTAKLLAQYFPQILSIAKEVILPADSNYPTKHELKGVSSRISHNVWEISGGLAPEFNLETLALISFSHPPEASIHHIIHRELHAQYKEEVGLGLIKKGIPEHIVRRLLSSRDQIANLILLNCNFHLELHRRQLAGKKILINSQSPKNCENRIWWNMDLLYTLLMVSSVVQYTVLFDFEEHFPGISDEEKETVKLLFSHFKKKNINLVVTVRSLFYNALNLSS